MARILVNYTYNKSKDEFKILQGENVFADMKVAVLETEEDVHIPLVVPIKNVLTVVDREKYEQIHKRFYLIADAQGNVSENPEGAEIWLPKDTNISKLKYLNGQLVMVQDEPKQAEEPKQKPKTKNIKSEA